MNAPDPRNFPKWFDPRGRGPGGWAYLLNRLSAIGLTIYLYLHLYILGKLAQGPAAFDSFIQTAKSPFVIFGELLVIFGALYHGLNGLRVALTSFGVAVPYQRQIFYVLFLLAVIGSILFAVRMLTA